MEPVFPDLRFASGIEHLAVHQNFALVGGLQKIEAAKQGGLAAAGGADDGEYLPGFQREADALEHIRAGKALFDIFYFQNSHSYPRK